MKKHIHLISIVSMLLIMAAGFTGCNPDYIIRVSSQDIRFGLEADAQTFTITANCDWSIMREGNEDWYTISPMSGKATDSIVTITVKDYSGGHYRGAKFVVNSPGGHVHRTVFVSQNKLDFYGIINKVFGATYIEHWNTDYYYQIIEDTYRTWTYDPFDTLVGRRMYFMEDGKGIQRHVRDKDNMVIYYPFFYEYHPDVNIVHIEFVLEDGGREKYDWEVLCASDSLFRTYHEYKKHWYERAEMRKVDVIHPEEKAFLMKQLTKRKGGEPIFIQE